MATLETSYCSRPVSADKYEEKRVDGVTSLLEVSSQIADSLAWMIVYNPNHTTDLRYIARKH